MGKRLRRETVQTLKKMKERLLEMDTEIYYLLEELQKPEEGK